MGIIPYTLLVGSLLGNQFFGDAGGHLFVVVELHAEGGAALRAGTQVGGVTEHFGERHVAGNDLHKALLLLRAPG